VAPAAFHGLTAPWSTDVWITLAMQRNSSILSERVGWLEVVGHLKSGITPRQAAAAMNALDRQLDEQLARPRRSAPDPLALARPGLSSSPLWSFFRVISALLMAVVGLIYLIACANVGGLLIARGAARRRETLIRLSLGVSRSRLIRQLLTESLLLGLLGAACGTALAYFAGNALSTLFPRSISHGFSFQHTIDGWVLAWTLTLAVGSVVFAGLLPALRASRQNLAVAGRSQGGFGDRSPRFRQGLIVAQVAASVLVLATAGVFIRSFQKSQSLKPGFDADHLLTVDLHFGNLPYSASQFHELSARAKEAALAVPGVESASLSDILPLGNERVVASVATATVDEDYFRTLGIPLLQGRQPDRDDTGNSVFNQALAARTNRAQPVFGPMIGIAANSKYWSLAESPRPFVYRIATGADSPTDCLAVRTRGPAAEFAGAVSQAIQNLNPDLPPMVAQTGQQRLRLWLEPQRAAALLLAVLGFAAIALAITGLYALIAQLLAQRTGEIAVRVALGATRRSVLRLLLGQGAILVAGGTILGIGAATFLARVLASGMGAIGTLDAETLAAIVVLLAAVAAAATAIPAYRALRIDPASALKSE
jgi:predicted permease